ncbi:MAG TPA: Lrp/AsnC family transcriptional regulator [Pseudolabrys sp.]|nr:Lrp/AsnC family transcriptional regulator [Pseudolabrys sp.]
MKVLRKENGSLDAVDAKLIAALAANARISTAELARMVKLSAPSVADRIRRLEESGVILGYGATIDPAAIGLPIAAWIRVRPTPGQLKKVADVLRNLPEIVSCDRITGEDCYMARAHVASVGALERIIDAINPFAMTTTSIIQSSPVERRLPPIAAPRR